MPVPSKNPRKRLSENASASRIAEANDVWHSTAIGDMGDDFEMLPPPNETPIRGKKPKTVKTISKSNNKNDEDSGRGRSETRGPEEAQPEPVVINPPSGHSFLSGVLQKCGYIIRQPATNNEMYKDMMKFRKTMADWMTSNDDEMSRIETEASKFIKALKTYLAEKPNFINSMKPTRHEVELIQPSLLHCLLGIEAIQSQIMPIVLNVMGEASFSNEEENVSLVNTILNQLKWLPIFKDGQKYADSLLAVIDSASLSCQSLIIKFIPDVLPSNLHDYAAQKLLEKFSDEGHHLNIALMDCFSSLDIPDGYWSNIRTTAIDQMATASLQDIPAYFSFLFRYESFGDLSEVVTAVREKVKLIPENKSPKMDAFQVEILEKVLFCVTVNPGIMKIWTKQVKNDLLHSLFEDIKKIDLLMLFIFAESDKTAIVTLKLLFAETQLTLKLFDELMTQNHPMVNQLFQPIAKILDSLLRSRDAKCSEVVCEMNVKLFLGLSPSEAQTLMGNMTSIIVNYPPSRETVLQILTKLAEKDPQKLLVFSSYLMAVLEYVLQFPAGQIRSLMNVLAIISQTEGKNGENNFTAEFSILLRKQLTHSDLKIRCFGVYGAMASVRCMAEQTVPDESKIRDLLKLSWNFVERDEDACSIFLDELSSCTDSLPRDICMTYRDILKNKFENLWTMDAADDQKIKQFSQKNNLKLIPVFDANKECTEDRLIINFENHPMDMSPLVVPAHLRVLSLLEGKAESKNLVGIDAILGCPILFPALQEYYERDSLNDFKYNQRHHLGQYLILAINFFRESICAFIHEADLELRVKVWLRLENILKLQRILVKHFDSFPSLPYAYMVEKTIGTSRDGAGPSGFQAYRLAKEGKAAAAAPKPAPEKQKDAPKKKSSKKKAKRDVPDSGSDDDEPSAAPVAPKKPPKVCLDEDLQPKKIVQYIRRFDQSVFKLLRFPLRPEDENVNFSRILMDISSVTQNPTTIKEVETFSAETLALLLTELRQQVSDPRSGLNILEVKKLLKYVCSHINNIQSEMLKNEENDMADITDTRDKLECCLRLLLDVLTSYFNAITKLEKKEKDKAIQKAIHILAMQAVTHSEEDVEMHSQVEILANVANYLGGLVSIIRDSNTALDHLKLLKNLHDLLEGHSEIKKAIDGATKVYLSTDWKLPSAKVDAFLKIWLSTAPSPIKVIHHLAEKLLNREDEDDDDEEGEFAFNPSIYKSCTPTNFHTWYTVMVSGLSQYVYKTLRRRGDFDDSIAEWEEAVKIFNCLVSIARKEFKPKNIKTFILAAVLKHCRLFLEAFISGGAVLLPKYLKQDQKAAQKFCKALQVPCRTLQHICEHSKINTDLQLLKSVPLVKRVLETFVFRVREVLGVHGAANAFWMGALKHRDLKGVCISSQLKNDEVEWSTDNSGISDVEDDEVQAAPLSGVTEADVDDESMDVDVEADDVEESGGDE